MTKPRKPRYRPKAGDEVLVRVPDQDERQGVVVSFDGTSALVRFGTERQTVAVAHLSKT